jgi:O-antigen ligase
MSRIIATGLVVTIVFTALAFGTVEAWSVAGFSLLITALMILWAIQTIQERRFSVQVYPLMLPLALFVLYGAIQSIAFVREDGTTSSLSLDVEATRRALPMLFFLFFAFVIASNFLNTPQRLTNLVTFLTFYGLALAVFALVQYFTWDGKFYWFRPTKGTAFGPFVNRNHFAGYMEMLIPFPVAMIVARAVRKELWMLYGFAAVLMSVAVVISLSRGGMLSVAAGLLFLALLKSRLRKNAHKPTAEAKRPSRLILQRAAAVVAITVLLLAGIVWLGAEQVLNRAADTLNEAQATQDNFLSRQWIWRDSGSLWRAHPIFGVGIGAYESVFPIYSSNTRQDIVVTHTHNDYLQALTDGGIIGGALALWFLILLFRAMWHSLASEDRLLAGVALGCSAGVFALLVHSFFDFNLQIPSNALLFLVLSAILAHLAARVREPEETLEKAAALSVVKAA